MISFKRYFRYVKLIIKPNVIYIIIIFSIISNIIINFKESEYEQVYKKEGAQAPPAPYVVLTK